METTLEKLRVSSENSDNNIQITELSLDEIAKHPIIERVAKRVANEVKSTSHTAHNSHYSSNS